MTHAVEFRIDYLLPRTQLELGIGDADDGLMIEQQRLQMRAGIALRARIVLVVWTRRRELIDPRSEILQQP